MIKQDAKAFLIKTNKPRSMIRYLEASFRLQKSELDHQKPVKKFIRKLLKTNCKHVYEYHATERRSNHCPHIAYATHLYDLKMITTFRKQLDFQKVHQKETSKAPLERSQQSKLLQKEEKYNWHTTPGEAISNPSLTVTNDQLNLNFIFKLVLCTPKLVSDNKCWFEIGFKLAMAYCEKNIERFARL